MSNVRVAGVGMIPFTKPGQSEDWDVMAEKAIRLALADAGITYDQVQQAYAGYVYADSTAGQSALYRIGSTGIPVVNVNNNCSTGSSALFLARQMVEAGAADCVLAFGFEQMVPGALGSVFNDRKRTMGHHGAKFLEMREYDPAKPPTPQFYGGAAVEYQQRYGIGDEVFAMIAVKARRHAANNPLAVFRDPLTLEEVLAAPKLSGPVTRFQACPPTCGAAAAVLVSPRFAARHGIKAPVEILAQSLTTDFQSTWDGRSMISLIGYDMTKAAADRVYEAAGVSPDDVDVVELHDCFTPNELVVYEALGLTPDGTAERYIRDGQNTYGGSHVVNPSGGLLSKGHPIGATGLAQCYELTRQLRGSAGGTQVDGARLALQHNMGMGGACVVTLYGRAQ
ncbi:lipid-transfer protein [Niveispirillum sp. KHB5.9]|uniref:lipid-transfer protein n=1 Tax=Niveispirillum sp. KHB5.9 TaxID=3400269 RepID=UPI003A888187